MQDPALHLKLASRDLGLDIPARSVSGPPHSHSPKAPFGGTAQKGSYGLAPPAGLSLAFASFQTIPQTRASSGKKRSDTPLASTSLAMSQHSDRYRANWDSPATQAAFEARRNVNKPRPVNPFGTEAARQAFASQPNLINRSSASALNEPWKTKSTQAAFYSQGNVNVGNSTGSAHSVLPRSFRMPTNSSAGPQDYTPPVASPHGAPQRSSTLNAAAHNFTPTGR